MADNKDTKEQVAQMTAFILNEAKDKAEEINAKALQEFSLEKTKIMDATKKKIQEDLDKKRKQETTKSAIEHSTAVNRSRLEKIRARQEKLSQLSADSKAAVTKKLEPEASKRDFITNLIVQGLLMLLEDDVKVRCRQQDAALVQSCLATANQKYAQVVLQQAGVQKNCKVTLDSAYLPPAPSASSHGEGCLGGVVLCCQNGAITIDNTIDSRLKLVLDQAKPTIRKLLFTK